MSLHIFSTPPIRVGPKEAIDLLGKVIAKPLHPNHPDMGNILAGKARINKEIDRLKEGLPVRDKAFISDVLAAALKNEIKNKK